MFSGLKMWLTEMQMQWSCYMKEHLSLKSFKTFWKKEEHSRRRDRETHLEIHLNWEYGSAAGADIKGKRPCEGRVVPETAWILDVWDYFDKCTLRNGADNYVNKGISPQAPFEDSSVEQELWEFQSSESGQQWLLSVEWWLSPSWWNMVVIPKPENTATMREQALWGFHTTPKRDCVDWIYCCLECLCFLSAFLIHLETWVRTVQEDQQQP